MLATGAPGPFGLVDAGWLFTQGYSFGFQHPMATDLNLTGIDPYQAGQWIEAFESFDEALQVDPDFVEASF